MQGGGCTSSCEAGGHDAPSHDGMSGAMQHHEFASGSHSERPHFGSESHSERPHFGSESHSERPHFASKWSDRGGSRGFGTVKHDEIRPPRARMHHNTEHHLFRPMQTYGHDHPCGSHLPQCPSYLINPQRGSKCSFSGCLLLAGWDALSGMLPATAGAYRSHAVLTSGQ